MSTNAWTVAVSLTKVTTYAWRAPSRARKEHVVHNASLWLLEHENGSVFMAILGSDARDILLIDFCEFWYDASLKIWTNTIMNLRTDTAGMFLFFPCASSLERFHACADRILHKPVSRGTAPTIQELAALGVIALPRIIGDFLTAPPEAEDEDSEGRADANDETSEEDASVDGWSHKSASSSNTSLSDTDSAGSSVIDELADVLVEEGGMDAHEQALWSAALADV